MKRIIIFGVILLLVVTGSSGIWANSEATSKYTGLSLGYGLNNVQHDFGYGLILTSPYFLYDRVAVRLSGNISYFEDIPEGKAENEWMPYSTYKLGLVGVGGMINDAIRLYGEGGFAYIIPNSLFSEKNVLGGYGNFGFEFFMNNNNFPICYFIEMGGMGTGARAEKLTGKPIYYNGFITSVGLRVHL